MIVLLSPSKTQDFEQPFSLDQLSEPVFLEESETLVKEARKFDQQELGDVLGVSEKLARLNYNRFQKFYTPFNRENAKPALLAYQGDVYEPIQVNDYTQDDFDFAQQLVRILSGLYGVLRPLDLIQPYRLEMNTKLPNPAGKDLYKFWKESLTERINQETEKQDDKVILNLASNQYFKVLDKRNLQGTVVTPKFKDYKKGEYKTIAIYAKKARGMMTDYIIRQRITEPESLKNFSDSGYTYNEALSDEKNWTFTRKS